MEHEILITRLFNDYLGGAGKAILEALGIHAHNMERPWTNWLTMELLVAVIIMIVFAILKPKLSMDKPGKMQHIFEFLYLFLRGQAEENVPHHGHHYLGFFATIFFFILFANLIGVIPGLESPTMFPYVPCGIAIASFLYYNIAGMKAQGAGKYLKHYLGPLPFPGPILMLPIEIISNFARPLSLTVRLYANMYAGEQVTLVFLALTYLLFPAVFMGLHVAVSFLQAYIFTLMSMIYVGGATAHEDH